MSLAAAVRRKFAPASRQGLLGVEVELISVTEDGRPADPAVLAAGFDAAFVAAARPSFEPGGQLELSPPPQRTVTAVVAEITRLIARARAIAESRGVRLEAVGVNPRHSCDDVPLRSPSARYLAMQRLFDNVGPDGRRMMRLTAGLHVNVDLLPGPAGREQWLVANLAGPALTAAFANSPADGLPGTRTRIWQGVDLRRTGYDGRHLDAVDPVGAYTAFAAAAERFPLAAATSPEYHLTTLFPPVRPRGGYLEIRYLDAQPVDRIGEAVGLLDVLLNEAVARWDALDLLLPTLGELPAAWHAAAAGFSAHADDLLAIAGRREPAVVGGAA